MEMIVNGERRKVTPGALLDQVVAELGFDGALVATALNGQFVPRHRRAAVTPQAGDRLEVLSARQGG